MASILQTVNMLKKWHYQSLASYEKRFIDSISKGIDGLGDIDDLSIKEYLSDKQIKLVRQVARKFLITEATKI